MTLQSGHLAWCALVALHLARQDGAVNSDAQASLFLTRWLATAQKQRRFPREIAPDIEWLLKKGRTLGVNAKLGNKLDYLWRSCTGELSAQNDMFRLTYALETARDTGWVYRVLSDKEWTGRHAITLSADVSGVYLSRTSLDSAFDEEGGQVIPLMVRLTGNITGFETVINRCGWRSEASACDGLTHLYTLTAVKSDPDSGSDTNRMSV
ncbi:DUF2913 family protein [Enterobacteriaceae bacterium RIT711]|nr:DUF2913 family protein [Enterobacteriaceae bacterium RIT711]